MVEVWPLSDATENLPMALEEADHRLFVGTRRATKLLVLDTEMDKTAASFDSSGDADDIFYDGEAKRVYVLGEGDISVFEQADHDHYEQMGEVETAEGARTSLFVAQSGHALCYCAVL